jgi:hypothetical protein
VENIMRYAKFGWWQVDLSVNGIIFKHGLEFALPKNKQLPNGS